MEIFTYTELALIFWVKGGKGEKGVVTYMHTPFGSLKFVDGILEYGRILGVPARPATFREMVKESFEDNDWLW